MSASNAIEELLALMHQLRQHCAWDKAQTPQSLTRYAIEEAYEVQAAIYAEPLNADHVKEELGDLLLQVVFQAEMYREQALFDFEDIVRTLQTKLIRRHPHVFDPQFAQLDREQVSQLWQRIKQEEQAHKLTSTQPPRLMDKLKPAPVLVQAQQLQDLVATVGLDWPSVDGAQHKLAEELEELNQAIRVDNAHAMTEELGDCLFSLINIARKLNISSEQALEGTMKKFIARFNFIEQQLAQDQQDWQKVSPEELDQLWRQAKANVG